MFHVSRKAKQRVPRLRPPRRAPLGMTSITFIVCKGILPAFKMSLFCGQEGRNGTRATYGDEECLKVLVSTLKESNR